VAENEDQLNPDEIEQLFEAADQPSREQQGAGPTTDGDPDNPSAAVEQPSTTTEDLLDQAEADLAAAVSPSLNDGPAPEQPGVESFAFESFDDVDPGDVNSSDLETLDDVELDVRIELGRTELLIEEVLKLKAGSVVPLDKLAGDPVDVLVNGQLVARGEVLVLNDNFCVRVSEILTPEN